MKTTIEASSPHAFERLMLTVWESEDWETYDRWHDANDVAKELKLRVSGHGTRKGFAGQGTIYRWSDGAGIWISKDGSAVVKASAYSNR